MWGCWSGRASGRGRVEHGHPAAAELALDRVAVAEGGLQTGEQISHAGLGSVGQLHHTSQGKARPEGRASVLHFRPPREMRRQLVIRCITLTGSTWCD